MITASMHPRPYQTVATNERHALIVDTLRADRGGQIGFKPLELLEAALATCTNLTVRIASEQLAIPVHDIVTTVETDTRIPGTTRFLMNITLGGDLSEAQHQQLLKSARLCPISKLLSSQISIVTPFE